MRVRVKMAEAPKNVLEFLNQLRKERDELNVLISGLEKRLGISAQAVTADEAESTSSGPRLKVSINDVPVGFFHNLSQVKATEKLLRLNAGQALTTQEILDVFRKSGMNLNPKNATTILYTALSRSDVFERVAGKAWGLSEWYPENRKRDPKKQPPPETLPPESQSS